MIRRDRLLVCLLLLPFGALARSVVVSDYLPINVRQDQSPSSRIIAQVRSGARLEVLEDNAGYLKVRTPKGNEGWVLERLTQSEPVARDRVDTLEARIKQVEEERAALQAKHDALAERHAALEAEYQAMRARHEALQEQMQTLPANASDALELQQRNAELQARLSELESAAAMEAAASPASPGDRRSPMLLGAGLVLVGLLLGLIAPFLRPRRKQSSGF